MYEVIRQCQVLKSALRVDCLLPKKETTSSGIAPRHCFQNADPLTGLFGVFSTFLSIRVMACAQFNSCAQRLESCQWCESCHWPSHSLDIQRQYITFVHAFAGSRLRRRDCPWHEYHLHMRWTARRADWPASSLREETKYMLVVWMLCLSRESPTNTSLFPFNPFKAPSWSSDPGSASLQGLQCLDSHGFKNGVS